MFAEVVAWTASAVMVRCDPRELGFALRLDYDVSLTLLLRYARCEQKRQTVFVKSKSEKSKSHAPQMKCHRVI